jgi:hypothetical protein
MPWEQTTYKLAWNWASFRSLFMVQLLALRRPVSALLVRSRDHWSSAWSVRKLHEARFLPARKCFTDVMNSLWRGSQTPFMTYSGRYKTNEIPVTISLCLQAQYQSSTFLSVLKLSISSKQWWASRCDRVSPRWKSLLVAWNMYVSGPWRCLDAVVLQKVEPRLSSSYPATLLAHLLVCKERRRKGNNT